MQKIRYNLKLFIKQETNLLETYTIRSVPELNQKFKQINDIQSFYNLIEQISTQIPNITVEKDKFDKFMRRLIEAICFALQKYAYDFSRTNFLVDTLNTVKKHWKQVLAQDFYEILNKETHINSKFLYILSKNEYMICMLKGSNILIEKQIFRLIKNISINIKSLFYMKKCNIKNIWTKIYDQMLEVALQTENQTYLKIELIAQFMKHILFQVNFCITQSDFATVYQRIFQLAGCAFRLIKKFYSVQIIPSIQTVKQILFKGILIYREISFECPNKHRYLSNLIKLFQQKKHQKRKEAAFSNRIMFKQVKNPNEQNTPPLNPKSYAIKLALRLMASWKKVKSRKDKEALLKQKSLSNIKHLQGLEKFKKLKQSQKKDRILANLDNQKYQLKNKAQRSSSLHNYNIKQLPILHNVQIRKQIEDQIDKEFGKLKYLKNYSNVQQKPMNKSQTGQKVSHRNLRPISIQKKRSSSLKEILGIQPKAQYRKDNNEEREINIEEYKQKLKLCRQQVNTQNRIKLYNPSKRSLLPHGGQKIASSSKFSNKCIQITPNQMRQKLKL